MGTEEPGRRSGCQRGCRAGHCSPGLVDEALFLFGFLYLFPIMLAAGFLPRWAIVVLGIGCALLSERFSNLDPSDSTVRLTFETLALCGCGLFTSEVLRNRRLSLL